MLRALVAALVVANLLFFGFTRGSFDGLFGLSANGDREPERMARQVRPELVRVLPAASQAGDAGSVACLEAGPVVSADAAAAESAIAAVLPAGAWTDARSETSTGDAVKTVTHVYRVSAADPATVTKLLAVNLGPGGKYPFAACPTGPR